MWVECLPRRTFKGMQRSSCPAQRKRIPCPEGGDALPRRRGCPLLVPPLRSTHSPHFLTQEGVTSLSRLCLPASHLSLAGALVFTDDMIRAKPGTLHCWSWKMVPGGSGPYSIPLQAHLPGATCRQAAVTKGQPERQPPTPPDWEGV